MGKEILAQFIDTTDPHNPLHKIENISHAIVIAKDNPDKAVYVNMFGIVKIIEEGSDKPNLKKWVLVNDADLIKQEGE